MKSKRCTSFMFSLYFNTIPEVMDLDWLLVIWFTDADPPETWDPPPASRAPIAFTAFISVPDCLNNLDLLTTGFVGVGFGLEDDRLLTALIKVPVFFIRFFEVCATDEWGLDFPEPLPSNAFKAFKTPLGFFQFCCVTVEFWADFSFIFLDFVTARVLSI